MSDSENDEDLKRAIALSLQDSETTCESKTSREVIDLLSSDDDDDGDLDAPVHPKRVNSAMTFRDATSIEGEKLGRPADLEHVQMPTVPPTPVTSFGSLDRKQMEEERLARVAARRQTGAGDVSEDAGPKKRKAGLVYPYEDLFTRSEGRQVKAKVAVSPAAVLTDAAQPGGSVLQESKTAVGGQGVQFPRGVVKKTWSAAHPRKDDIKIEEVLQKNDLVLAVMSAFQVDADWISSKLLGKTKVIWVLQAKTEWEKKNWRDQSPANYRFCFPSMEGQINCMHSKLQLLAHPTHLRVVVPSANLVPYDWGETGAMENSVFLIDLPRLPPHQSTDMEQLGHFGKELLHFVKAMGLDEVTVSSLCRFDFSQTDHLAFIHTVGGSHSGEDMQRTGICGLANAVKQLSLDTEYPVELDIIVSSIGSLDDQFMRIVYSAAQGVSPIPDFIKRADKPAKATTKAERDLSEIINARCRIYFPTRETVAGSRGGVGAGGTICFNQKWFDAPKFPAHLMRDCKSTREGLLSHNKIFFVRPSESGSRAWAYVGSANLSPSAWGKLVRDTTNKLPKICCRNWECGVILSSPDTNDLEASTNQQSSSSMDVFDGTVPIPMQVPGEDYRERRPWFNR